jgi:ubiquinone/menaquinone biosynthesis C-methylase UbiE
MTLPATQDRFAGVIKIIRFNVQFYAGSALGLLVVSVLLASRLLPRWLESAALCGAAAVVFWTLSSLLVSWYVYDYAGVTRWKWMSTQLPVPPRRWANIHAGLDESSLALRQLFPGTEGLVIDIYEAAEMTEPSIARARRMYPATEPFITGRFDSLPLPEEDRDTVFLLFAAHEVRDPTRRTQLLRETNRVLQNEGRVVLVEHLRDWKNFVAFGPGFLHFHSWRSWHLGIRDAGLRIERDNQVTPFVRCFVLRKADA